MQSATSTDPIMTALRARWLRLTRDELPRAAVVGRWPIKFDHCFMRICLDNALGRRWDAVMRRPAIRHIEAATLARAVSVAESILAAPDRLGPLNACSLAMRRAEPAAASRPGRLDFGSLPLR